jgi:hypothetical protein
MIVAQVLNKIYLTGAQSIARFGRFFYVVLLRFNTSALHLEAFYRFRVSDRITVTPGLFYISIRNTMRGTMIFWSELCARLFGSKRAGNNLSLFARSLAPAWERMAGRLRLSNGLGTNRIARSLAPAWERMAGRLRLSNGLGANHIGFARSLAPAWERTRGRLRLS